MAQVRTFHLTSKDLGLDSETFRIDQVSFRETLASTITECERQIQLPHKTCQCIPMFFLQTGGSQSYDTKFFKNSSCLEVYVILTF